MATKKVNVVETVETNNEENTAVIEVVEAVEVTETAPKAEKKAKAKKATAKKKTMAKKAAKTAPKAKKVETKPEVKETAPKAKETVKKEKKSVPKAEEKKTVEKPPRVGSLAAMIVDAAKSKYPYRNAQGITMIDPKTRKKISDEEFDELARHRGICQELVRLSKDNDNFPYTPLVYFAIGSDAHKKPVFDNGYKTINISKAETVLRWLADFAKYNKNPKFYTCEKIVHAFSKLYDKYSKKDKDFKTLMRQFVKQPAAQGFKSSQYKTMQQFYELFTKPLLTTVEVNEETNEEKVVAVEPNPLAEPTVTETSVASCTALVLYKG